MDPLTHLAEALDIIGENAVGLIRSAPVPELLHTAGFPTGPMLDRLLGQGWSIPTGHGMRAPSNVLAGEDATIRFGIETPARRLVSPYVLRMVAATGLSASVGVGSWGGLTIVLVNASDDARMRLADALEDQELGVDGCFAVASVTEGPGGRLS